VVVFLDLGRSMVSKVELLRGGFDFLLKAAPGPRFCVLRWLTLAEERLAELMCLPHKCTY
jgi:hypothetical protein